MNGNAMSPSTRMFICCPSVDPIWQPKERVYMRPCKVSLESWPSPMIGNAVPLNLKALLRRAAVINEVRSPRCGKASSHTARPEPAIAQFESDVGLRAVPAAGNGFCPRRKVSPSYRETQRALAALAEVESTALDIARAAMPAADHRAVAYAARPVARSARRVLR